LSTVAASDILRFMDIKFLSEADTVTLQFEKAKRALESAKVELETAKKNYDEMLSRADEMGIPKAKLKKITEDRIQSLVDNGLLEFSDSRAQAKEAKPKKAKVKAAAPSAEEVAVAESAFEKDEHLGNFELEKKDSGVSEKNMEV